MKRLSLLTLAAAMALSACQPSGGGETIKLGFVGPLTGDAAALGIDALNGAKMAVAAYNKTATGPKVELIAEDGKCTPAEAANAFQKLINVDKVVAVIGGLCSGETLAGAPVGNEAKVVVFSYGSSSPKVTDAGDFVFRDYPSDAFRGVAVAKYFAKKGYGKVAIITQNTDYATGLRDSVVKNVGADGVVFNETVEESAKDFRTLLTRLKDVDFDVFVPNMQTDGAVGALISQYREMGFTQPVVGNDTTDSLAVAQIAGDGAEGVQMIDVPSAGEGTSFETDFKAAYGDPQSSIAWAAYAYDAAGVVLDQVKSVGTDGSAIRDALYGLKGYKGIIGTFHFDKNGDVVGAGYVVKEFQGGKIMTVGDAPLQ